MEKDTVTLKDCVGFDFLLRNGAVTTFIVTGWCKVPRWTRCQKHIYSWKWGPMQQPYTALQENYYLWRRNKTWDFSCALRKETKLVSESNSCMEHRRGHSALCAYSVIQYVHGWYLSTVPPCTKIITLFISFCLNYLSNWPPTALLGGEYSKWFNAVFDQPTPLTHYLSLLFPISTYISQIVLRCQS